MDSRDPSRAWPGYLTALFTVMFLAACATLTMEKPRVNLVNIQPLGGELLEQRFRLTLRVQNPNPDPLEIRGITLTLAINDYDVAEGVGQPNTTIDAFSEATVEMNVSTNVVQGTALMMDLMQKNRSSLAYRLNGRVHLGNTGVSTLSFSKEGELSLKKQDAASRPGSQQFSETP